MIKVAVKDPAANRIVPMEVPAGDWISKSVLLEGAAAVALSLSTMVPCESVKLAGIVHAMGVSNTATGFDTVGVLVNAKPKGLITATALGVRLSPAVFALDPTVFTATRK